MALVPAMADDDAVALVPAMADDDAVALVSAMADDDDAVALVLGMADDEAARACCSLDCFLAAALVCQPHEHRCSFRLSEEKNDPFWRACWHLLMDAMAATTSLLEGFWPLPVKAGRPSARSMSWSAYCLIPRK